MTFKKKLLGYYLNFLDVVCVNIDILFINNLGWQVRLENKVAVHSGILCLNPKVITILGGVVLSLYEEWEMSRKYSVFSRSSVRPPQESDGGGPPPFEKLQIRATSHRFAQRGRLHQGILCPLQYLI